jgi:diketogulonate reductase-like aldo/keto reductase
MGPVIAGVTRTEQITANVKAAAWKLTDDEMKQLDQAYGFEIYSLRPEIYRRWDLPDMYLRMS